MFIKFGDKTKKIIVKNSKDGYTIDDSEEDDVVYLDSDDENDRRIKTLRNHIKKEEKE